MIRKSWLAGLLLAVACASGSAAQEKKITLAVPGIPPVFLAWARIALGAAALLTVVPWRDVARALRRHQSETRAR